MTARGLASLHPAYFAMVMATGIVSIAAHLLEFPLIATALLWLNSALYLVVWILNILRVIRHPAAVAADFLHHGRCVGFFTVVAATSVLGSQWLVIRGSCSVAIVLWYAATALWAVLTYCIYTVLTVKVQKPPLAEGLNGGWLLGVVAPQSIAVLGAQLAPEFGALAPQVLFFALTMWFCAGMLYIWIISLIFYRYTFFTLNPSDLAPPYWINMGAVAISTLAGTQLVVAEPHSALLTDLMPFVKGFTVFYWATATWWIPMLVILGVWRHIYRRFPLRYDPLYWGAVFPLGMYTACTFRLANAIEAPFLLGIPRVMVYVSMAAWATVFAGLLVSLAARGESPRGA